MIFKKDTPIPQRSLIIQQLLRTSILLLCSLPFLGAASEAELRRNITQLEEKIAVLTSQIATASQFTKDSLLEEMFLEKGADEKTTAYYISCVTGAILQEKRHRHYRADSLVVTKFLAVDSTYAPLLWKYYGKTHGIDCALYQVLPQITDKSYLPMILKNLNTGIDMKVIDENNWHADAEKEILALLRKKPEYYSVSWIRALLTLKNEKALPYLKEQLISGHHRSTTIKELSLWPEIDWSDTILKSWKNKDDFKGQNLVSFARIVAAHGSVDALVSVADSAVNERNKWLRGECQKDLCKLLGRTEIKQFKQLHTWLHKHQNAINFSKEKGVYSTEGLPDFSK